MAIFISILRGINVSGHKKIRMEDLKVLYEDGLDREKLHVTFLEEEPEPTDVSAIQKYDFPPDAFRIIGKEVYLFCPGGYGNTKLSNTFFEKKLHVKATTRNWKTVGKLAGISDSR